MTMTAVAPAGAQLPRSRVAPGADVLDVLGGIDVADVADVADVVDVWGNDSFPASDPPANW